ncbi:hypothetical protein [Micropruina sp.]|uniref:hypothetical protein n=1 Tax=Micropruina sp. TaxID=2737536 RepID=UPI0039E6F253
MTSLSDRRRAMRQQSNTSYTPPGWPERVRPPGAPDWEVTATEFLLDCCPADYRRHGLLRRHPVVLARFAVTFVNAQVQAGRDGLGGVRLSLAELVAPEVVTEALDVWAQQQAQLVRVQREARLVEEALRGKNWVRRL